MDFLQVYDENVGRVHGFFVYRVRSRADAEDLTQLTFERALRAWARFDERRSSAGTWLLVIARNLLVDHYRHEAAGRERLAGAGADEPPVMEDSPPGLDPEVAAALARLTRAEREVIALRFGADLPGPEISELLGQSLANVQQLSSRALRKLRAELEPDVDGQLAKGPMPSAPAAGRTSRAAPTSP